MRPLPYVYLASPYSHDDPAVRLERYEAVKQAMTRIALLNIPVYSPIVHWHIVAVDNNLPVDAVFWQKQNESMMLASGGIWVLCIDGWRQSRGVAAEIAFAERYRLPVYSVIPDSIEELVKQWLFRYHHEMKFSES
jgi:hypothetical protein